MTFQWFEIFLFTTAFRLAPVPTQWVLGGLFPLEQSGRGVALTTHLYLMPKIRGAILSLPHASSRRGT